MGIGGEHEDADVRTLALYGQERGHVEPRPVHHLTIAQGDIEEGIAGGAGADGRAREQIRLGEAQGPREAGAVAQLRAEARLPVPHPEKARPRGLALERHLDRPDPLLEIEAVGVRRQEAARWPAPTRCRWSDGPRTAARA